MSTVSTIEALKRRASKKQSFTFATGKPITRRFLTKISQSAEPTTRISGGCIRKFFH